MNSNELFQKSLKYVPGGVHSPVRSFKGLHTTPRFINRGKGAYIWDEDGKNYIDFLKLHKESISEVHFSMNI